MLLHKALTEQDYKTLLSGVNPYYSPLPMTDVNAMLLHKPLTEQDYKTPVRGKPLL